MEKYRSDGPFEDPVVRCCECSSLVYREQIQQNGMCACGNRRVRNLLSLNDVEMEKLKERGVDPDFIKLFEGVPDV